MLKLFGSRVWALSLILALIFTSLGMSVGAQDASSERASSAAQASPARETFESLSEPPSFTDEQQAQLALGEEITGLSGPVSGEAVPAGGPPSASESARGKLTLQSSAIDPEDFQFYRRRQFGGSIPAGFKSNVMESSVGIGGRYGFFTGNWFAARSTSGGHVWSFINPFSGFPDFCCDQVTLYDESRDMFMWLRMGIPKTFPNGNYQNVFKLSISTNGGATWCTYTTGPRNTNSGWSNQWWDYPHIQLGADYAYLAWNVFNQAGSWTRTVLLRWPLDALSNCAGFSYFYYQSAAWFTFVPISGAWHTMYFASNWPTTSPQNSRLRIWRWHEDSTSLTTWVRNVTPWSFTGRGSAVCGSTSGNWAARYDQRLLSGTRYSIMASNLKIPGRKVIAWWWNVRQGGNFPLPYIEAAAFYEDNMAQVGGNQGRPLVWSSVFCFAYPSANANKRQDFAIVFHFSQGTKRVPNVGVALADDNIGAPPGFLFFGAFGSRARPSDNRWGDYNTTRVFEPTQKTWVAGSHVIRSTTNCSNCSSPVFMAFGRHRDFDSWFRWRNK